MNRIKLIILITVCLSSGATWSQGKDVNKLNAHLIGSIDWNRFEYDQLLFLDTIFRSNNLLVLSEAGHGDGGSYDAQCMMLKALIDSSKISAIYTESSWMIIDKITDILNKRGKAGIKEAIKHMRSVELRYWADNGFWDYLANKIIEKKVRLHGFDVGASKLIVDELFNEAITLQPVKDYIKANPVVYQEIKFQYEDFDGWSESSVFNEKAFTAQKAFIETIIKGYESGQNQYRVKQWKGILNFFYWMYKRSLLLAKNKYVNVPEGDKQFSAFMAVRDSLMANEFLSAYKQNEKSVLLVSNFHAVRNAASIEGIDACCKEPSVKLMGDILEPKIGKETYSLCFISASGSRAINYYYSRKVKTKLPRPVKNSLELELSKLPGPYYYLDLESAGLEDSSFYMNAVYYKYLNSRWSNNFSGVFFIKEMYPLEFKNYSILKYH